MSAASESAPQLGELLVRHREDLLRFVERHAGSVLRYESGEDLVQAIAVHALRHQSSFEYRGEEPFFAWIHRAARQILADRRDHWSAIKRGSGKVLRMTLSSDSSDPGAAQVPASQRTGAVTRADRREQLVLVVRAIALLSERDKQLVRWHGESVSIGEQAQRLALSYDAAQQAGLRAMARFQKTFRLLSAGQSPRS